MNIANKTFKNNSTGETIRVIDSFEDIAILENKQKVNVKSLMDTNQYTELIDPSTFFNTQSAYDGLVEKIKSIPLNNIVEESLAKQNGLDPFRPAIEESAIIQTTEEDELAELARKYGAQIDNQSDIDRQNEAFRKLLNTEKESIEKVKDRGAVVENKSEYAQPNIQRIQVEDPIISMFKNVKRNVDFSISIDISNKIPRLDFIEMMEDSYETSIIDFLSEEFTNNLLKDPSIIRESIKKEIKKLVYAPTKHNENIQKNKVKESTKSTIKERIDIINGSSSIDEIESLLKGERSKNVIKLGNKRIELLKNN
jgi:hypothetical protein